VQDIILDVEMILDIGKEGLYYGPERSCAAQYGKRI